MGDAKIQVLVVDDDAEQRESLVEWLNREGMKATATDSAEKALASLEKDTTIYEVLLADQRLRAGMDGLTLLKQVKVEYPALEVVLFSGQDLSVGLEALRAGAYRYITKPYSLEELTFVVRQAAEHRRLKQEAVLSKLAGVVQAMTGKIADGPKIILQQAVESAIDLVGADCGTLYLYDISKDEFYFDRENIIPVNLRHDLILTDKPRRRGMAQYVRERGIIIVNNINEDLPGDFKSKLLERENIKSFIGVAVRTAKEKLTGGEVGVLYLNFRKLHRFTDDEKSVIQVFANLVASVVRSAWLLERTQAMAEQQTTLREITNIMNAELEPQAVADKILDELQRVVEYRMASMQRIRGDARVQLAGRGFDPGPIPDWALKPISEDALIKPIVANKEMLILSDLSHIPENVHWERHIETEHIQSWVCVPLIYGDEVIGLLTLDHDQAGYYQPAHKAILALYAMQAAIAIRNAELVADLQRQIKGRDMLNRVGIELSGLFDEAAILNSVSRAAAETLPSTHCTVFRVEDGQLVTRSSFGNRDGSFLLGRAFPIGAGVAGWVAKHNEPALIPDSRIDSRFQLGWSDPQADPLSLLDVPIVVNEEVYGVISVEHDQLYAFDEHDQRLLQLLALQVGQAVRNARLYRMAQERVMRLTKLQKVATLILAEPAQLEGVANAIVNSLRDIFDGAYCAIRLYDPVEGKFEYLLSSKEIAVVSYYPPRSDGISAYVARTLQPVYIEDVTAPSPPGIPNVRPERVAEGVRAAAYLPLTSEGRLVGRLSVYWDQPRRFLEDDKLVLALFSDQAAIAVKNASMYQHSRQQFETLEEIIGTIGSAEDPLPPILKGAAALFGAHYGSFSLADANTRTLAFYAIFENGKILVADEIPEDRRFQSWDIGITGYVARTGSSYRTGNVAESTEYDKWYGTTVSELAVALKDSDDQVIGVLNLESPVPDAFDKEAERLCRRFADVAALAIEKARLLKTQKHLVSLYQIAQTHDIDSVLVQILKGVNDIVGEGTSSGINLYDEDTGAFGVYRVVGALREVLSVPPRLDGTGTGIYVIRERKPLFLTNVQKPPDGCPTVRQDSIDRGIQSFAALPLERQGRVLGVLFVNVTNAISFTKSLRRDLELFASQAAIALDERQRKEVQIKAIQEISVAIANVEKREVILNQLLESTLTLMANASWGSIRLVEGNDLALMASRGKIATGSARISIGMGISGWVAQHGESQLVPDVEGDKRYLRTLAETRSEIAVPMKRGEDVIGVLNIEHPQVNAFTKDDLKLAEAMAGLATVTITNAELYQEQERLSQNLARYNHTLAKVLSQVSSGDLKKVLYAITERSVEVIGGEHSELWLIDSHSGDLVLRSVWGQHKPLNEMQQQIGKRRLKINSPSIGMRVVRDKLPYYICEDFEPETAPDPIYSEAKSSVTVPLTQQEKIVGVLNIESKKREIFVKRDVEWLTDFANIVAIALENARSFEETRRALQRTQTLGNLGSGLADLEVNI